jgi:hypothetical protein
MCFTEMCCLHPHIVKDRKLFCVRSKPAYFYKTLATTYYTTQHHTPSEEGGGGGGETPIILNPYTNERSTSNIFISFFNFQPWYTWAMQKYHLSFLFYFSMHNVTKIHSQRQWYKNGMVLPTQLHKKQIWQTAFPSYNCPQYFHL